MSDNLKEFIDVIKDAVSQPIKNEISYRARNAFLSTLIVSWLCYNWYRVAFFLLENKMPVLEKIYFVKNKIPDNSVFFGVSINHTHTLWYPVTWALLVSLTAPLFTYAFKVVHKKVFVLIDKYNADTELRREESNEAVIIQRTKTETARNRYLAIGEAEIETEKLKAAQSRANIQSLKLTKETLDNQIENLSISHKEAASKLSSINQETLSLTTKLDELRKEHNHFSELALAKSSLEAKLEDTEGNLAFVQDTMQAREDEIKELKNQLQAMHSRNSQLAKSETHRNMINQINAQAFEEGRKLTDEMKKIFPFGISTNQSGLITSFAPEIIKVLKDYASKNNRSLIGITPIVKPNDK
ncbi:hypothetical protein [Pantoea agglomerans]|uniref:hypothetical protein n=1 Tax=Enterobacter agglomerans TaxID=549 RepID=UPI003C7C95DD